MSKLTWLLARRYLQGTKKDISIMAIICFLGIFIGSFALTLIASVMNGFEKVTHKKMQSIHPQIILHAGRQELNTQNISRVLTKEFPEIKSFSTSYITQVICQADNPDNLDNTYDIVIMKGVNPLKEPLVCDIENKIIQALPKEHTLEAILKNKTKIIQDKYKSPETIIIGQKMAENLSVNLGEKINLFFTKDENITRKKINLKHASVIVGGIFKTGIQEFDNNLIISSLATYKKICKNMGESNISIKLKKNICEDTVIKKLRKRFGPHGIAVNSWKELYPALVQALKLEKYAMFLILALITLVASMSIISLLFMQITLKRRDIAILKAMGMPQKKICCIFLYMGMVISFIATLTGLLCAFIASWMLEHYSFIKLPDAYYVTHLPAKMEWHIVLIVFGLVMLLSFLSTWLPARKTRSIHISEVLRFEG